MPGPTRDPDSVARHPSHGDDAILDTRERILGCAIELFGRRGYEAVAVADIAQTCGVSTALIYYHYSDKESLLRAIVERAGEVFDARSRAALAPGTAARERLERFITMRIEDVSADEGLVRILIRPITDPEGPLAAELLTAISRTIEALAAVITEGIEAGEFEPVDPWMAAECLFGLVNTRVAAGALSVPYEDRIGVTTDEDHAAFIARLFFDGIAR